MHAFELQSPDDDLVALIRSRLGQHLRARPANDDAAAREAEAAETERVRQAALAAFVARAR